MQANWLLGTKSLVALMCLVPLACSKKERVYSGAAEDAGAAGETAQAGGGAGSGGKSITGGTGAKVGSAATGGKKTTVGSAAAGGTSATSATTATGGTTAVGGTQATGGTTAAGGTQATGGTTAVGGTQATGGTTAVATTTVAGSSACDLSKPFGTPTQVVNAMSVTTSEHSLSVSADGLSAIVAVSDYNDVYHLKFYTRSAITTFFANQQSLSGDANINVTTSYQTQPRLTRDGLGLFFTNRFTNSNSISFSSRSSASAAFAAPVALNNAVNSAQGVSDAWIDTNGQFYWEAAGVLRQATMSIVNGAPQFTNVMDVSGLYLGAPVMDNNPVVSNDNLTFYFSSNRASANSTANTGYMRTWKATRSSTLAGWGNLALVTEIDQFGNQYRPVDISANGCILYFSQYTGGLTHLYQAVKPK